MSGARMAGGVPPRSEAELFEVLAAPALAKLAELAIAHDTRLHPPVFTVEDAKVHRVDLPGAHVKNLFVKDKAGKLFLITVPEDAKIDLKRVHTALGAKGRVSFASAEQLKTHLGILPGSVSPLALMNDKAGHVTFVLCQTLAQAPSLNVHPLTNTHTTNLKTADLLAFCRASGHEPLCVLLPSLSDLA